MRIKCIALDLDRTTLNAGGHLSAGNRAALEAAIANGIHVCIASGRAFDTLPKDVLDIKGIEYAITSNGAAVYKIQNKECLRSFVLTEESVCQCIALSEHEPVTYEAFVKGKAYAAREYIENPEKFGATSQAVAYVQNTRIFTDDIKKFMYEHIDCLDSIDIVVKSEAIKENIMARLKEQVSDIYITSSVEQLIEISYKDAGKRSGVQFIAEHLGLQREEIAAFGDGDNDVDMLEYAGVGIAVENASQRVRQAADYVTLHHDADGVAYACKEILKCI